MWIVWPTHGGVSPRKEGREYVCIYIKDKTEERCGEARPERGSDMFKKTHRRRHKYPIFNQEQARTMTVWIRMKEYFSERGRGGPIIVGMRWTTYLHDNTATDLRWEKAPRWRGESSWTIKALQAYTKSFMPKRKKWPKERRNTRLLALIYMI